MRVAVVGAETAHHGGDAAVRLGQVTEILGARGHDVTVFCATWWDDGDSHEVAGVRYRGLIAGLEEPARRFAARLPRAIRSFDPDVIHARNDPWSVLMAAFAGTVTGVPVIVDWYEHRHREGWRDRLVGLAARAPDLVVAPSRLIETGVQELGRSPARTTVVPNAIDMDAIRSITPEPGADFVYSRALDADAYAESFLLALAELRELDWTAAVIGDGPARERYETQAADLRIDDRVEFMGEQPVDRRIAVFKGAHVAVHTALYAPFATDFLRALACGCVGIAEYHAGSSAHELVEHIDRGFRTTSEGDLVDALRAAADLDQQSIDETFEPYDERRVIERYLEQYRRLRDG